MNYVEKLQIVLESTVTDRAAPFTGLGVVLYRDLACVPVFPLRVKVPAPVPFDEVSSFLRDISTPSSDYHDGFHLISSSWSLTHVSQYFSPPIAVGVTPKKGLNPGGRYMAALFGSMIEGVILTAIIGADYRMAIFSSGAEVLGKDL